MDRQATVRTGDYEPLIDVKGLPCWPVRPRWEQLVEGEALRTGGHDLESWWDPWPGAGEVTLEHRRDYDTVVLGLSLGVLPSVCAALVADEDNPRFRQMVTRVRTTQTQAAQLWLDRDLDGLQWNGSTGKHLPILIPWAEPFDTWSDMTYLLPRESWPESHAPRHLAYLCAPLRDQEPLPPRADHGYPEREHRRVRDHLERWLRTSAPALWTGTAAGGDERFDWSCLVDPAERAGSARLGAQYWCATRHPSDRYVLSVPGSSRSRLRADESGYGNLVLAGDWTLTALSIGCLEAATMSGMAAACVVDGECRRAYGDWLPRRAARTITAVGNDTSLPRYISTGQLIAVPPLRMRTALSLFFLDADLGRLTALCDRYLNLPGSTTAYRPLAPRVVLYCSRAETGPIDDPIGWCPEKDFGFWVPVVARDRDGTERCATFTPWLWVDSGVAMVGGREVYGFVKELATLSMPGDPAGCDEYSVDTLVLPRYAPDARVVQRRLLAIRPSTAATKMPRALAMGGHALAELEHLLTPGVPSSYMRFASSILRRRSLRMVFLKQFPDIVDATRACYQAIVEAPVRITGPMRGDLIPGHWSITVSQCVSHPIVDVLGLVTTGRTTTDSELTARAQAQLRFDARVEPGVIVFERAAQRNQSAPKQELLRMEL
jgi:hypothetical protein